MNDDAGILFGIPTPFGTFTVTDTVAVTWGVMAAILIVALIVRSRLNARNPGRAQQACEALIGWLEDEIRAIIGRDPAPFIPLIAAIFVFILVSNLVSLAYIKPPTADITTTAALALVVFLAVPFYGVMLTGPLNYLKTYVQPYWVMLPLNIIGEFARTLALAMRLFGNMFSGEILVGVMLALVPFILPLPLMFLSLIAGTVQAYIFAVLTMVYIAGAVRTVERHQPKEETE